MARRESDREDLMREATALRRRVELALPEEPEPVLAGCRPDGALSLYFGADPVYHLDAADRLRRAFVDGRLYRSQGHTLARLTRLRTASTAVLERSDLPPDELRDLLETMRRRLERLAAVLAQGRAAVLRQVPEGDAALLGEVQSRIASLRNRHVTLAPAIRGKK